MMTSSEKVNQNPTRAQAEDAVRAMLDVADARENLATLLHVTQYATWRARFDEMQNSPASSQLSDATIFRGDENENTMVVLADVPDSAAALAWAKGGWKSAIPAEGIEGAPAVYFGTNPGQGDAGRETAPDTSRATLKSMTRLRVTDYGKWHELFLVMESSRFAGGLSNEKIFHNSEDENDLLVLADVADPQRVRDWLVEDYMTGYPDATGADSAKFHLAVELETQ